MKRSIGNHWHERTSYYVDGGDPSHEYVHYPELVLLPNNSRDSNYGRVLSISLEDGMIFFNEKCDDNFSIEMTPQDAIAVLEEAIAWIREQTNG